MLDMYGNYVISTTIEKAFNHPNKKYFKYFSRIFKENLENLKKINFGKKFINKIEKIQE